MQMGQARTGSEKRQAARKRDEQIGERAAYGRQQVAETSGRW